MTKIEALELELAARKMVDGTGLGWVEVLRTKDTHRPACNKLTWFNWDNTELALGIIEGKPMFAGDAYYDERGGSQTGAGTYTKGYLDSCRWSPPTPKTVHPKTEKLRELLSVQSLSCDCHNDNYFRGMYNGMEVMLACVEEREAIPISPTPKPKAAPAIRKNPAEIQSGHDRQRWAEGLILQMPSSHNGRNSWLLNYGVSDEAEALRKDHPSKPKWSDYYQSAETTSGSSPSQKTVMVELLVEDAQYWKWLGEMYKDNKSWSCEVAYLDKVATISTTCRKALEGLK